VERLLSETKEELNKLKVHPRETYDDVITRANRGVQEV
jgi:hypothetical protein